MKTNIKNFFENLLRVFLILAIGGIIIALLGALYSATTIGFQASSDLPLVLSVPTGLIVSLLAAFFVACILFTVLTIIVAIMGIYMTDEQFKNSKLLKGYAILLVALGKFKKLLC